MGGFTKSLINFLLCADRYPELDITVMTLQPNETNDYLNIPKRFKYLALGKLDYLPKTQRGLSVNYLFNIQRLRNIEYLVIRLFSKIYKKPFPNKTAVKFMSFSEGDRARRVITDFSFTKDYDIAISWEEIFCNYLLAEKIQSKYKIGYIHPNYRESAFNVSADYPFLKKLDRIVTISKSCENTLREFFPSFAEKIVYVPNRLNICFLQKQACAYQPDMNSKDFNILTVARMVDGDKAIFRIARLARRLLEAGCDFKWYLVGDGSDLTELKSRITLMKLEDNVICKGQLDNPCPYMKTANLFVMQSHKEGRPVAVDEAMALGTPALITNYSSASEQVEDNVTGWICKDDEEEIFKKLLVLLQKKGMITSARTMLQKQSLEHFESCESFLNLLKTLSSKE